MVDSDSPVIMVKDLESRKIAFVPAEGWWKWKLHDYLFNSSNIAFDELFAKLTQYLVLKEDKGLFHIEYKKQYEEHNDIFFYASLYNESYELVNNKQISLSVNDSSGREYKFQFQKDDNNFVASLGSLESGVYDFTASVEGTKLIKQGVFDVKAINLETLSLSSNNTVLEKISALSGGEVYYPDNLDDLMVNFKDSSCNKSVFQFKEKIQNLIDVSWFLIICLIFIFAELFVRKYKRLI